MDGTSQTVLHSTGLNRPYGLTLDYDSQTLYWINYSGVGLETSNIDGTSRRTLTRVNIVCPYGLTYFNRKLYWGDWCNHVIYSTSIDSPNSVSVVVSTSNDPYRIQVISKDRQPINGQYSFPFVLVYSVNNFHSHRFKFM